MEINIATVLHILKNGKKYFFIVFLSTFVVSTVIAFLLPVVFASTSVFFALSPRSYDPRMKFSYLELYGTVEDINRTVELAESGNIKDYIVKKYNLAARYEYDTTSATGAYYTNLEYYGNLIVKETSKGAISITFYDKDPDTAAMIVNDIVDRIDHINKEVVADAVRKQFDTYQKVMLEKYNGLDSLNEILQNLRKQGNSPASEVTSMEMFHTFTRVKESEVNLEALSDDVKTLQVIQEAKPNRKKEKPKRMLIVGGACLSTFILTLLFLLVKDRKEFELEEEKDSK